MSLLVLEPFPSGTSIQPHCFEKTPLTHPDDGTNRPPTVYWNDTELGSTSERLFRRRRTEDAIVVAHLIKNSTARTKACAHLSEQLAQQKCHDKAFQVLLQTPAPDTVIIDDAFQKLGISFAMCGQIGKALDCTLRIRNVWKVEKALKQILPQITDLTHIDRCGEIASSKSMELCRSSILCAISRRQSDFQKLRESLHTISQIPLEYANSQAKALAHLAMRLPDLKIADEVLSLITALPSEASDKNDALGNISVQFAKHGQIEKMLAILPSISLLATRLFTVLGSIRALTDLTQVDQIAAVDWSGPSKEGIIDAIVEKYTRAGSEHLEKAFSLTRLHYSDASPYVKAIKVSEIIESLPNAANLDRVQAFADSFEVSWKAWEIRKKLANRYTEWGDLQTALQMIEAEDAKWRRNWIIKGICKLLEKRGETGESQRIRTLYGID